MKDLIIPKKLSRGDKVAIVSLSWGGAGDEHLLWRYNKGKKRLEEQFGLCVVEMENTLKGSEYLYNHPEKRAEDLMNAFLDDSIKAIFACIGGDESIRLLPYIDFEVIRKNPKIFVGYSDSTITHLMCFKAGVASYYGPSILAEFAENIEIFPYTAEYVEKALFSNEDIVEIKQSEFWTDERLEWSVDNENKSKKMLENTPIEFLQGNGTAEGRLFGGCIEVLEMAKGTELWPEMSEFDDCVLFFETSEVMPSPDFFEYWLRNYGTQGILQKAKAIVFGKPYQEKYYEDYKTSILKILKELSLTDLPVVYNMPFGHNEPMCIIPYGAKMKIDCLNKTIAVSF